MAETEDWLTIGADDKVKLCLSKSNYVCQIGGNVCQFA